MSSRKTTSAGDLLKQSALPAGVDPEDVKQQLERILSSKLLARSDRLIRFLKYVVQESLAGRASDIKEYSVGVEVFDRPDSYDTRVDPIVRVEAGRLRGKIREYYATAGKNDSLFLGLRKRGYLPLIRLRETETAEVPAPAAAQKPKSTPKAAAPIERGTKEAGEFLIAVLPFADLSAEGNQEYFCDALTQQIITSLTKVPGLRVVGKTLIYQFADRGQDIRSISEDLNVGSVLEGGIQRLDSRVRISVQLMSAANGLDIWGDVFDHKLDDIFAVQDAVTTAVVEGIRSQLLVQDRAEEQQQISTTAYNHFLRGLLHWQRRFANELEHAIESFEKAVEEDPKFAPAHAGLACCYASKALATSAKPADIMPRCEQAAVTAIELQPDSAKAIAALGLVNAFYHRNWQAAYERFEAALALQPSLEVGRQWFSMSYFVPHGDLDTALEQMEAARGLNPPSVAVNAYLGLIRYMRREWGLAEERLQVATELEPRFYRAWFYLGRLYLQTERYADAIQAFEKAEELSKRSFRRGALCQAYAAAGQLEKADEILRDLLAQRTKSYAPAYDLAEAYWGLGDREKAWQYLNEAAEERSPWVCWIGVEPMFATAARQPQMKRLLEKLGLAG